MPGRLVEMATNDTGATGRRAKPSPRADGVERALRDWILRTHPRPGDRLPPDTELARMMGVARGTLRTALQRLQDGGVIVRRQGSGTFVSPGFAGDDRRGGLEVLESYREVVRRQGHAMTPADIRVERTHDVPDEAREVLGLDASTRALVVRRTMRVDDEPAILMLDVVHPDVVMPRPSEIRRRLAAGRMVLDVMLAGGVPVAYGTTHIRSRLVMPVDADGQALELTAPLAALELAETTHLASAAVVKYSCDLFASQRVDLHVVRAIRSGDTPPPALAPRAGLHLAGR